MQSQLIGKTLQSFLEDWSRRKGTSGDGCGPSYQWITVWVIRNGRRRWKHNTLLFKVVKARQLKQQARTGHLEALSTAHGTGSAAGSLTVARLAVDKNAGMGFLLLLKWSSAWKEWNMPLSIAEPGSLLFDTLEKKLRIRQYYHDLQTIFYYLQRVNCKLLAFLLINAQHSFITTHLETGVSNKNRNVESWNWNC